SVVCSSDLGRPGAHCRPPRPHGPGPRQRTLLPADQPRRHRPLPGGRRPLGLRHPAPAGRPRPVHRPARGARMTPTPKTPDGQETDEVYRVRGQRAWRDGAELSTRRIEALATRLAAVARARRPARGARMTPPPETPDGQETDEVYRVRGQRVCRDGAELSPRRLEALATRLAAVARARREAELRAAYPVGTRVWLRGDPTPRTVTGYTDSPGLPPSLRLSGHTIARPRQVTRTPPT